MVKVSGACMSNEAHGSLAKQLTYSRRKSGQQVRDFHYPKKEITQKQGTQRHIIALLTAQGQTMTLTQRLPYETYVVEHKLRMSGFNYFIKVAQADLYTHSNLVAYGSMNELSGPTAFDYSGNGYHATLKPTYPSDCPRRDDSFKKSYGKALHFDGNDYLQTPSFAIPNTGILTVEMGVKNTTGSTYQDFLGDGSDSPTVGYFHMYRYTTLPNDLHYRYANGSAATYFIVSSIFQNLDSQGIHITVVCDYTNKKAYVYRNGVQFSTTKILTGTPVFPSVNRVKYIGAYAPGTYELTDGSLDEVRIYNRGLSAEEIKKHYNILRFDKERQPGGHPLKK